MSAWLVEDTYTGERIAFKDKYKAEGRAIHMARVNHEWHCVKKQVGDNGCLNHCLCFMSHGKEECAAHHYQRTVQPHSLEDCTLGEVTVEEIEIY